eukprot:760816-Hanusia_phi.AAC.2
MFSWCAMRIERMRSDWARRENRLRDKSECPNDSKRRGRSDVWLFQRNRHEWVILEKKHQSSLHKSRSRRSRQSMSTQFSHSKLADAPGTVPRNVLEDFDAHPTDGRFEQEDLER